MNWVRENRTTGRQQHSSSSDVISTVYTQNIWSHDLIILDGATLTGRLLTAKYQHGHVTKPWRGVAGWESLGESICCLPKSLKQLSLYLDRVKILVIHTVLCLSPMTGHTLAHNQDACVTGENDWLRAKIPEKNERGRVRGRDVQWET